MDKPNLDVLQRHNLPVVFLAWREPGDVKVAMQLLGEIFHKPVVAERYSAYFDGIVARVAAGVMHAQVQKPTVLYWRCDSGATPRLIAEWWIEAAGGTSVTNDGRSTENTTFTLEQLWPGTLTFSFSMPQATVTSLPETSGSRSSRLLPTSTST